MIQILFLRQGKSAVFASRSARKSLDQQRKFMIKSNSSITRL